MQQLATRVGVLIALVFSLVQSQPLIAAGPIPPKGFRAIFNGEDLTGWYGWNPHASAKLTGDKKEENLRQQRDEFASHWRIENGELVNDGHGPYATTDEEFGDIEFLIEYKTVASADSGIYLRGTPQVQIWDSGQAFDPKRPTRKPHLGSGGLFNNSPGKPGRHPLVNADRPFGEWNQFRIRQVKDRTWVWLNDQLVVDGAVMENYWDRSQPLPVKGPIMLQTHGGEIRWRNVFVREIGSEEAAKLLAMNQEQPESKTPPNIIVFLVDDMGVMDTSVPFLTDENGEPKRYPLNDYYRTPNMQRLASQGIRFNNFYAMSVCSPTRISIMTGQNAARHAATNWINPERNNGGPQGPPDWNWTGLRPDNLTLPRLLQNRGYRTIHVGKGHFGSNHTPGAEPLNLGFDHNIAGAAFGAPGSYYGEKNYGEKTNHAVPHLEKYHGSDTFLTEALTLETKALLDDVVKSGDPFYLYMAQYAVHAPFHSDPRFADHYKDSDQPANAQAFATLIEGMDKSLGDLLDHLHELGIAENTLIFFLGDNGSDAPLGHQHAVACAAPLRGKKGAHYEGGMRVPFIAAWAKPADNERQRQLQIPAGVVFDQVANVTDILPTVASIVGVPIPDGYPVDGASMTRLLTGQRDPSRKQEFLMHYPHSPHRSSYFTCYRDGDWKVIYHYFPSDESEGTHYQLYNLKDDPFEQTNLAESNPEMLKKMMQQLASQLEQKDALYPVDQPNGNVAVTPIVP